MFRHISNYYIIPIQNFDKSLKAKTIAYLAKFENCPYINIYKTVGNIFVSTNGQFLIDNPEFTKEYNHYNVSRERYKSECLNHNGVRYTFLITTQISTSRELNRVSPNNIAEQSTRYVKFDKGIGICEPHWYNTLTRFDKWLARLAWKIDEWFYNHFLSKGLLAQDAREFLPLCSYTRCVYTYTLEEWRHILNLRYYGTTGKPHPNAKNIAAKIRELLIKEGECFRPIE